MILLETTTYVLGFDNNFWGCLAKGKSKWVLQSKIKDLKIQQLKYLFDMLKTGLLTCPAQS